MSISARDHRPLRSLRAYSAMGFLTVAILLGGLAWWATTTHISGAAVEAGEVAIVGDIHSVSHPNGGVVSHIYVVDGEHVNKGQSLFALNGKSDVAQIRSIETQIYRAELVLARMDAQSTGDHSLNIPSDVLPHVSEHDVSEALRTETNALSAYWSGQSSSTKQLRLEVLQLEHQKTGLAAQRIPYEDELETDTLQMATIQAQTPTTSTASQITALQNRINAAQAALDGLTSQTKGVEAAQAERRSQIQALPGAGASQALSAAETQQVQLDDLRGRLNLLNIDQRAHVVKAPVAGTIFQSQLTFVGGVIAPDAPVMQIVPTANGLRVDVKILPSDINNARVGSRVEVKFPALNQRTTPTVFGRLASIAAAASTDPVSRSQFFEATVTLSPSDIAKLPSQVRLIPGMQAEIYVDSGDRSVLAYFVKPIQDQFSRVFREP